MSTQVSAEEIASFERMLADLSARFANVSAEAVESEIQVAQTILRQFLGFDRCTFAEFQDDGSLVVLSSAAAEGVEPTPRGGRNPSTWS
jgi:light-regulated signal transduction histidine kinase (bacteriophytochrome)